MTVGMAKAPTPMPPLTEASLRLRRKPGRPKKAGTGHVSSPSEGGDRFTSDPERGALAHPTIARRLLDLEATAAYLSVPLDGPRPGGQQGAPAGVRSTPWRARSAEAAF